MTTICPSCGKVFADSKPQFCPECGCPSEMFVEEYSEQATDQPKQQNQNQENANQRYQNPIYINTGQPKEHNGIGTTGFIIALMGLFTSWIPVLGWILWVLGALFSLIGLFKTPRGLAIAGFIISFFGLIILLLGVELFSAFIRAF